MITDTLKAVDPELVSTGRIDRLNQTLHGVVLTALIKYSESKDSVYLKRTNNQLDQCLMDISDLHALAKRSRDTKPLQGIEKQVDNFAESLAAKKDSLSAGLEEVSAEVEAEKENLRGLTKSIEETKAEKDALISSWRKEHSEEQEERAGDFTNTQEERARDFTDEQDKRNADFTALQEEFEAKAKTKIEDLHKGGTAHLENVKTAFDTEIEGLRADAAEKHEEILGLYGLVGKDSVTAGYTKTMEEERKQAVFWRWVTIGFIIITFLWIVCSYIWGNDSFALLKTAQSFSVAGVLLFGAGYSARQSALHRKEEMRTRWFALEVSAIDPFIQSLDDADQKALKSKLSERLFGQNQNTEKGAPLINNAGARMIMRGLKDIVKIK